jgi:hypothetical protein
MGADLPPGKRVKCPHISVLVRFNGLELLAWGFNPRRPRNGPLGCCLRAPWVLKIGGGADRASNGRPMPTDRKTPIGAQKIKLIVIALAF